MINEGKINSDSFFVNCLFLFLTLPLFLLGMLNNYLPIKLSALISKIISKRPVFWRSTDMAFSILTVPLYYFIVIRVLFHFTDQLQPTSLHFLLLFAYLILMPFTGIFAFNYIQKYNSLIDKIKSDGILRENKREAGKLSEVRKSILQEIYELTTKN